MILPHQLGLITAQDLGPAALGYFPPQRGGEWFRTWLRITAPRRGYKIHVAAHAEDAVTVAKAALPHLQRLRIAHKIVRSVSAYRMLWLDDTYQGSKLVTIYVPHRDMASWIITTLDPLLHGLKRGDIPLTEENGRLVPENPIGTSGLLFFRWYELSTKT
jgi:hypothetical protein